ncbi:FecR family protein [Gabonibacter chumensis]|uniref:FecR family protein n=1 Tax=Gabonibacter chumensis TaxID=2972474 RepID=UPI0025731645|nr:FecR family protein [Gabonibacter chumensis]MCR9012887.1 FecR domain-containing protein [Gabonibacter chumensis]
MDERKVIEWVVLYCKKELTSADASELRRWLREDQKHVEIFRGYLKRYRRGRQLAFWDMADTSEAWCKIEKKIRRSDTGKRRWITRYYPYAAMLVLLLSVSLYWYMQQNAGIPEEKIMAVLPGSSKAVLLLSDGKQVDLSRDSLFRLKEVNGAVIEKDTAGKIRYVAKGEEAGEEIGVNTILVPRGGEYFLQLSDGTKVWLNSDSKLVYPVVFGKENRSVRLEGEGYFEVAKDESRPFLVQGRGAQIRVLGTHFNVSAYEQQEKVVTTLVEGCVRISNGRDSLLLKPGEQAVSDATKIDVRQVDVRTYVAWKSGVFEFEKMELQQITAQLGRWYDVEFIYSDESLRHILFTGAADRHRDMSVLLGMIEKLSKIQFIKKDRIITVSKK